MVSALNYSFELIFINSQLKKSNKQIPQPKPKTAMSNHSGIRIEKRAWLRLFHLKQHVKLPWIIGNALYTTNKQKTKTNGQLILIKSWRFRSRITFYTKFRILGWFWYSLKKSFQIKRLIWLNVFDWWAAQDPVVYYCVFFQ